MPMTSEDVMRLARCFIAWFAEPRMLCFGVEKTLHHPLPTYDVGRG